MEKRIVAADFCVVGRPQGSPPQIDPIDSPHRIDRGDPCGRPTG